MYLYGPCHTFCHCYLATPKTVRTVCALLGFCNLYHKFIPNFSNIIAPLTVLTQKNAIWTWDAPQQSTFSTLLSLFQSTPVLHLPNTHQPFVVMTDASLLASGAVLMQQDSNGDLHPCAYLSQTFSPTE